MEVENERGVSSVDFCFPCSNRTQHSAIATSGERLTVTRGSLESPTAAVGRRAVAERALWLLLSRDRDCADSIVGCVLSTRAVDSCRSQ